MAQQGKSAHIHLLQKELYYTETQHISFIHLSVLPISPDNNDLKKRKEKKKQVKISLAPFYGGVIQSVLCHLADLFALSPKHTQASTSSLSHYKVMHTESQLLDQHARQLLNQGSF